MLAVAFPPLDQGWLAWVALVPLLVAGSGTRGLHAFGLGWLTGTTFFGLTVYWVAWVLAHHTRLGWPGGSGVLVVMALALGSWVGLVAWAASYAVGRDAPALLFVPLWVVAEWLRGHGPLGFPWVLLGTSQHESAPILQVAAVGGVYGVSALVALVNVVLARALVAWLARRSIPRIELVLCVAVVCAVVAWGNTRITTLSSHQPERLLRVGIVQGNVSPEALGATDARPAGLSRYLRLTRAAATAGAELVVWPESAFPGFYQDGGRERRRVTALVDTTAIGLMFGSSAYARTPAGEPVELNRAYLVLPGSDGSASYDKRVLVPFAEAAPFAALPAVDPLVPVTWPLAPGTASVVLHYDGVSIGALVCWEAAFPDLARTLARDGARLLVNLTNDAWLGTTAARDQHLALSALRAVENGLPLVRAANTGISAVVDPRGRVVWRGRTDDALWHVALVGVPSEVSVYARHGDVLVGFFAVVGMLGVVMGWRRRRASAPGSAPPPHCAPPATS